MLLINAELTACPHRCRVPDTQIQRFGTIAVVATDVCDGEDVVVEATVYAEHAVLEICDVKDSAPRLFDLAERRVAKKRWSC